MWKLQTVPLCATKAEVLLSNASVHSYISHNAFPAKRLNLRVWQDWSFSGQTSPHLNYFWSICCLLSVKKACLYLGGSLSLHLHTELSAQPSSAVEQGNGQITRNNLVMLVKDYVCSCMSMLYGVCGFMTFAFHQSPYLFCHTTPVPVTRHNLAR